MPPRGHDRNYWYRGSNDPDAPCPTAADTQHEGLVTVVDGLLATVRT
ncbi:hypothetical protein ACWC9T_19445 [Kitasatospora sp. NPDC001159]